LLWAGEKHCRKTAAGDLEEEHTHLDCVRDWYKGQLLVNCTALWILHDVLTRAGCRGWWLLANEESGGGG
jgi:hypothetical protein